jgi:hypothetical protein
MWLGWGTEEIRAELSLGSYLEVQSQKGDGDDRIIFISFYEEQQRTLTFTERRLRAVIEQPFSVRTGEEGALSEEVATIDFSFVF